MDDYTGRSHAEPAAATSLRQLIQQAKPETSTLDEARLAARSILGSRVADLIEWETDERHDRLYGHLRHEDDNVTIFYDDQAVWANLLATCPCPVDPRCPLGYDIATSGNLLRVLNGTETNEPHCPMHAPPDTY